VVRAKTLLVEAGLVLDAAYPVRHAERLQEIVREEIAKGRKFIILGGGDGTISSVVDHFAYTSVVFGVLPLDQALLPGLPIALISVALKPVKSASKPIAARSAISTRACFVGDMAAALNNTDEQSGYRAAALLRQRMERCGVSRWHPDPVAACEAAEAEAKRVG
jgi:Diacylglycerol kinase catalytic domain